MRQLTVRMRGRPVQTDKKYLWDAIAWQEKPFSVGVAHGCSKPFGSCKIFRWIFTGLAVWLVTCFSQSWFFQKAVLQSWLHERLRKPQSINLFHLFSIWHLNILEPEHLELALKQYFEILISQLKWKCLGVAKKNAYLTFSHLPFITCYTHCNMNYSQTGALHIIIALVRSNCLELMPKSKCLHFLDSHSIMYHFTDVCSVTWQLNGSKAGGDLVLIQISQAFVV